MLQWIWISRAGIDFLGMPKRCQFMPTCLARVNSGGRSAKAMLDNIIFTADEKYLYPPSLMMNQRVVRLRAVVLNRHNG